MPYNEIEKETNRLLKCYCSDRYTAVGGIYLDTQKRLNVPSSCVKELTAASIPNFPVAATIFSPYGSSLNLPSVG